MLHVLSIIAPMFMLLGVGMLAGFAPRFQSAQAGVNAFVFYFSLPAFLFVAVTSAPIRDGVPGAFVWVSLGVTALVFALVHLAATVLRRVLGSTRAGLVPGPLAVAATYGNVGYLGVPIVLSVVGPEAALGAALGQLLHNMLFMVAYPLLRTLGGGRREPGVGTGGGLDDATAGVGGGGGAVSVVADGPGAGARGGASHRSGALADVAALMWRVAKSALLLNPVVLGVVAGIVVGLWGIELPGVVTASISMLGQAAVPAAMFAVGLSIKPALAGMRSGSIPVSAVAAASAVKLAVLPLATLVVATALSGQLAPEWIATAVIMAAMPVSSTASIIVYEFDGDVRLVGATTLVTSVLAVVTIPFVLLML
ncbi:AEC family transporter [Leucobacter albus]|uniref:AEC family transporter n=1 Tax=Leucobacter albus TaxID=272210 RepID=A0ABW3TQE5_9MICO